MFKVNLKIPRKLVTLNHEQKYEICKYKKDNPSASLNTISTLFSEKFKTSTVLKLSTLSRILKDSDNILNKDFATKFRERKASYPELEEALFIWFCNKRDCFIPISDEILINKAKIFGSPEFFGVQSNFNYSIGWLSKFKLRYRISAHTIHGESAGIPKEYINNARERLKKIFT